MDSPASGLLAAGGDLRVATLLTAYRGGIFPWFSQGQPILWWSPNPRMVLRTENFVLHHSLRRTLKRFTRDGQCQIRIDSAFPEVINACANTPRRGQPGTWILPAMQRAYQALHLAGYAHSVETWIDGKLAGGLYCVAIGRAVFGESMFTTVPDASKIALAALVAFCREYAVTQIDCQQNTGHLTSLGAAEMDRTVFLDHIQRDQQAAPLNWSFNPLYWKHLFPIDDRLICSQ